MKHTWYKCPTNCDNPHCNFCRGGLGLCTVCNCAEGTLPTDCPGEKVNEKIQNKIYAAKLDFIKGKWIKLNNTRIII